MEREREMNTTCDNARHARVTQGNFETLTMPIVASPEPEAPPAPETPQTLPAREDPRYPAHTPPAPDRCPHPVEPLPDDEPYPACVARS